MAAKRIRLTESTLRSIVKECVARVVSEANKRSARRQAMADMAAVNTGSQAANDDACRQNQDLDTIDAYQAERLKRNEDPNHIEWKTNKDGNPCPQHDSAVSAFLQHTRSDKDKREHLADIINGKVARPDSVPYTEEYYDLEALPAKSYDDIEGTIASDLEALGNWNDD